MLYNGIIQREAQSQMISHLSEIIPIPPKSIKLEICSACNFSCNMCYNKYAHLHTYITDKDFNIAKKNILNVNPKQIGVLFGGESTMHPKLPYYISQLKTSDNYVFLTTNGLNVSGNYMNQLMTSGLNSLKWSVNYWSLDEFVNQTNQSEQSYYKILDNIRQTFMFRENHKLNVRLYASVVVDDINSHSYTEQFLDMYVKPYVDEIVFNQKTNQGGLLDHEACSNVMNNQIPCPRLFNNMYIRSNLDVVQCCNGFTDDFKIGNLHITSLSNLWNCEKMQFLRKCHISNNVADIICNKHN